MSSHFTLRKGLNIPLKGEALLRMDLEDTCTSYALKPSDFPHLVPKLLVHEGDTVLAGSPVFCNKAYPHMVFTSPVSGTVQEIVRGEKRKLTAIRIAADGKNQKVLFPVDIPENLSPERIKELLLESGCWPFITRRPYGTVARPEEQPLHIYISCFDTAPLAPDLDFAFAAEEEALAMGLRVMERLCPENVHLGLSGKMSEHSVFERLKGKKHYFTGPHPAGNPGVQIHRVCPAGKNRIIWTLTPLGLAIVGKLFLHGWVDTVRMVAVTGPALEKTGYIPCLAGTHIASLTGFPRKKDIEIRTISGNPLTGDNIGEDGFLGFHHQHITLLEEGNKRELFGWARPLRLHRFSTARTYLTFVAPLLGKTGRFALDTNTNGDKRAFVMTADYRKVLPMDILVSQLLKTILAGDVEKMEQLGIYEILPEDLALCEFICSSKIDIQDIVQQGIALMIKEMQ